MAATAFVSALFCAGGAAADEPTLGAAAAASGRYFGAALDPGAFDEQRYATWRPTARPQSRRRTR